MKARAFGIRESDWQDTPEAMADWIAWRRSLEPIEISPADDRMLQMHRQDQKEFERSSFGERAERLQRMWE